MCAGVVCMNMPGMGSSFHAMNEARSIVNAFYNKGWADGAMSQSGTLSQRVIRIPVFEIFGKMLCLQIITGRDTDADDDEQVTFANEFWSDDVSVFVTQRNTGNTSDAYCSHVTEAGFKYQFNGGSNNHWIDWMAIGFTLEDL